MTDQELKALHIGLILIYTPTNEPFKIDGLNTIKRDNGSIKTVSGIDGEGLSYTYNLSKCKISDDSSLIY